MMLLALLLAQQAPPAAGQQPPATMMVEPVAAMIAACDSDADGRTSRAELTACVARTFAAVDTSRRGSLGYIDFADWAQRWLGDRNALPSPFSVDADQDDRITLAELQANLGETFTRLDKDKDGFVTRAELLTIRATFGPDDRRREGKRGKRPR